MLTRPQKDDKTDPSSHTVYSVLTSFEKEQRLRLLHHQNKSLKQQVVKLKNIEIAANKDGITVDDELHKDLKAISNDNIDLTNVMYPGGSFQRIFWDQQTKAASLKKSSSMRWHPLYIKWSLYLNTSLAKHTKPLRNP